VTSGGGIPTGSVVVTSGATSLCTITLSGGAGSCQAGNAPQGSDTILATYGGDPNFSGSTNTTNLTVGQALTTLTATVQPSAVLVGQPVALSASISSLGGTPTGTITFSTSGGAVLLCSAPLSGSVANCSETTAPVGVDAVTALYGGTGAFAPTSSSPVTLDVGPPAPPPPAGASASNQATSPSTGGSATAQLPGAQVTGQGQGALTLSSFAADPKGPAVAQGTGIFLAVSQVGFTAENGSVCNLGVGKSLVYWNGTAWVPLPSQQLSTPSGCISFTLTPTSTPSIGGSSPTTIYLAVTQQVGPEAGSGYWLAASDGGIFGFGDAAFFGSTGAIHLNQPIVGMAPTPDSQGYWLVASDGGIFAFGDATFYGSTGAIHLNKPIVGMTVTPDGKGYWLVASDGGIFAFGDAVFHGSTGAIHLNQPIVAMTTTPSGKGYWLVASDGGIFAFGDAVFHGSTGAIHLNQPIVGMATTPTGQGYWLVASDGGIFVFGNAVFHGSTGAIHLNQPIVSASASVTGNGYYLVAADGGIFNFGDAKFYGSAGGTHLNRPIVTMAVG
jgi:ribosomal protein L24E